ncbi:MAG: alpha/beta hydrolase, partial [Anaerolineales bacterium]|nr:alpha/beta hydrolase [Anaerolineales bacterium]
MVPQLQIPSLRRFLNEILVWTSLIGGSLLLLVPERTWLSLLWRLPLAYLVWQVWVTYRTVHPSRLFSNLVLRPDEAGLRYQEVTFPSRDGLRLSGFFIPGKLRAALIIVHGAGGSAGSMVQHAEFLAAAGYNLLLLDLRAHGGSAGDTLTFGLKEANDVLGAVDYLHQRLPLSKGRLGLL